MTGARREQGTWPRRSWASLDQVERVDLYTRQSLYVLLWSSIGCILVGSLPEAPDDVLALACTVTGAVVLGVLGTRALTAVADLYPAPGPLPWREVAPVLAGSVLALSGAVLLPADLHLAAGGVVWVVLAWSLGGLRDRSVAITLLAALTLIPPAVSGVWWAAPYGLVVGLFFLFTVRASLWLLGVVTELDAARTAHGALAVAEERLRFSRDVHDVLGRHLSTIAVRAELGATLASRGDATAPARMLEVRALAHEALREARELARGYRGASLAQELDGARSLLAAAGIRTDIAVTGLDARWHEPAAWVVREAVTNVLRHSSATTVTISYVDGWLEVRNDGVGAGRPSEDGNGLLGLRDRLAPLGAALVAGPAAAPADGTADGIADGGGSYVVRVRLPERSRQGADA